MTRGWMVSRLGMVALGLACFGLVSAEAQRRPGGLTRDTGTELEGQPLPKDANEEKILKVLDDIYANEAYRNVPKGDGRVLRLMAESMNAQHIVEIGTSTGISGIWFGVALQKTGGTLVTYEIDPDRAATAQANFKRAGMDNIITLVLGDAHEEVTKLEKPIDILFLDADKQGYIDYLNKLLPLLRPGGLVIAHNINPRMADPDFLKAITTNPELETIVRMEMSFSLKKH